MKKILFATTALVFSAGFAAADISLSGSAGAGMFSDEDAGTDGVYSFMKMTASASVTGDNGVTASTSLNVEAGNEYDPGDLEDDGDTNGVTFGNVKLSTDAFALTLDSDGVDDLSDDDNTHDVQVDVSAGDFSVSLTADMDADNAGDAEGASEFSYKAGFSMAGISVTLSGNDLDDSTAVDLGYTVSDALGLTAHIDQNGGDQETKVGMSYDMGAVGLTASYAMYDTAEDDWDLGVSYSEGGMSVSASTDEESDWELTGSYDLGGGLSAIGGMNADEDYYVGVAMSF